MYRRDEHTAIVIGKQVFGSRCGNGALSMTAITTAESGSHFLIYLNQSTVDLLGGLFGAVKRSML